MKCRENYAKNSQWRLLGTSVRMRVGRWALQGIGRIFWHEIQYIVTLSRARRDACLCAMPYGHIAVILSHASATAAATTTAATSASTVHRRRRCRLLRYSRLHLLLLLWLVARVSSRFFHLHIARQSLECDLIRLPIDDQNALLLRVLAMVALEHGVGHTRAVWNVRFERRKWMGLVMKRKKEKERLMTKPYGKNWQNVLLLT